MRALVLKEYNQFVIEEVPLPSIGPEDVLIQVKACGICGSDVHGMDGSTGRRQPPIIMGHEAAGIITEVGAAVQDWRPGERVTFDSTIYCGRCGYCRKGLINLCDNRQVLGVSCDDYRRHGAFAEFVAVPQHILYRLPNELAFEQAAITEALSIAVHAAAITPLTLNDSAVVVGTGMIGLLVLQVLRAAGSGTLIAVDVEEEKLEMASQLGAQVILNPRECDVPSAIAALTQGRGVDLAFEVCGASESLKTAIASVRKGGTVTAIGNISPQVDLPLQSLVTRQIRLQGSCASCGEYPACLDLIASGRVNVDTLLSATAPLDEGAQWFQRLYHKEKGLMKVVLCP